MSNPTLNSRFINDSFNTLEGNNTMTITGVILKTLILGILLSSTFIYEWSLVVNQFMDKANMLGIIGFIGAFILSLIIVLCPKNKFLILSTPMYAMFEGLFLGFISSLINQFYPGIAFQAATGTIVALFTMLILYVTKIIKCTDKFMAIVFNSTAAIAIIYLLQIVFNLLHIHILNSLSSASPIGIVFSIICVVIASLNLIIDFEFITRYENNAEKSYEWYFGFSLMVTLVWLYLEILNLLMKLQSRR